MAVVGVPGWIGSSSRDETRQNYMTAARQVLRLPTAGWMSEMAGRSREVTIYINTANHNYNYVDLQNALYAQGTTPVRIEVTQHLAAYSTGVPLFNFPADLQNEYITLYITSNVMGRGGNGGGPSNSHGGKNGGNCIHNWIGGRLRIDNRGAICGGGGGGGDAGLGQNNQTVAGGSGGRPLGLGGGYDYSGNGSKTNGNNASYDSPGARTASVNYGTNMGGAGGEVGQPGEAAISSGSNQQTSYPGGAAGMAVAGTTPTWINRGNIYGATV